MLEDSPEGLQKIKWEFFLIKLPQELKREIFKFLNPDIDTRKIKFSYYHPPSYYTNYHEKYVVLYDNLTHKIINKTNNKVKNMLSRIEKKNEKHRYYLTEELHIFTCNGCGRESCYSQYCRGSLENQYWYKSKYIGKCLEYALYQFYQT